MVVEVWAAVAGASVGVASAGLTGMSRQNQQGIEMIRLTTAVDNLASRLDVLHADIRLAIKRFLRDWQIWNSQWRDWKDIAIGTKVLMLLKTV